MKTLGRAALSLLTAGVDLTASFGGCEHLGSFYQATVLGGNLLPVGWLDLYVVPDGATVAITGSFTGDAPLNATVTGTAKVSGEHFHGTLDLSGDVNLSGLKFSGTLKRTKLKMKLKDDSGHSVTVKAGPGAYLYGFIAAKVDGALWVADHMSFQGTWLSVELQLNLRGSRYGSRQAVTGISLSIADTGLHFPWTYTLGSLNALTGVGEYVSVDEDGTRSSFITDAQNTGSMTICSFNTKKGYATGTFSFVAGPIGQQSDTSVTVTDGSFRMPVYIPPQ